MRAIILDRDNIGHDLDYSPLEQTLSLDIRDSSDNNKLGAILHEYQVAIANRPLFTREVLEANPQLRLICLTATGTNTVDLEAAERLGIGVCNVRGYSTDSVVQHSFAMVLHLLNRLEEQRRFVAEGSFLGTSVFGDLSLSSWELAGKTWGIYGMGTIGQQVGRVAMAFGAKVVYAPVVSTEPKPGWTMVNFEELLSSSDILTIHAPISDHSRNKFDHEALLTMKTRAILANTGRGGIVNEADLAKVLQDGHLGGAGLDVTWPEPPEADNPLLAMKDEPRLLITPHLAWAAVEARQRALAETKKNIEAFIAGEDRNRVL